MSDNLAITRGANGLIGSSAAPLPEKPPLPDWLLERTDEDQQVFKAPDGTFVVWVIYREIRPLFGIPTENLAQQIVEAMWQMDNIGSSNAALEY